MNRPKRTLRVILAGLVVAGSIPLGAFAAQARDGHGDKGDKDRSGLEWKPCPDDKIGMQCADLEVPVEWEKPDGRKITLKLGRLPATGKPEGSTLVAYGGPGAPGIAMTREQSKLWDGLRKRMDVVTWDTRGYGEQFGGTSTGLPCDWNHTPLPAFPNDTAEFGRLWTTTKASVLPCRVKDPAFFDHMSSADQARDMDAIRKALGEPKLNFYGASYAGFYAQAYVRLFPSNVRTMVLDGTANHATKAYDRELDADAASREWFMRKFVDWCDAESSCALNGRDVSRTWRRLVAAADRRPVEAPKAKVHYDGSDLRNLGIGLVRGGPETWKKFAVAIRDAERGNADGFTPEAGPPYASVPLGITECLDLPRFATLDETRKVVKRLQRISPHFGAAGGLAVAGVKCAGWPTPVTNPPAPLPKEAPPLLGAGTWGEYQATMRAVSQVPGSRGIYHDGPGHTLYWDNPCAREHIDRYLTDRVLPPPGTHC